MKRVHLKAKSIEIHGVVQGVGFRPFLFNLAKRFALAGEVFNTEDGLRLHVEGEPSQIALFLNHLKKEAPPLSLITNIHVEASIPMGFSDFSILESRRSHGADTLISPDMAFCDACFGELFDKNDRRFHYPFINCTHCGPRYTIIEALPYDRPHTTMNAFVMCDLCLGEYDDPENRRFHAQPNACPVCGPHVALFDRMKTRVESENPVGEAIRLLKEGSILAIKGIGGYHLCLDAENDQALLTLRQRKDRPAKPFAIMVPDLSRVSELAYVDEDEKNVLLSPQRPIVLLKKRFPETISPHVSPGNTYLGVMLPYAPIHALLLETEFQALVMTSGNRKDEPIAIDNEIAFERLAPVADYFLIHDREIRVRCDDSIVRRVSGETRAVRRARGYAPLPVFLKKPLPMILACGAEMKSTICLTKGRNAFLSQHLGDLNYLETHDFFQETVSRMERLLDIFPEAMAHDLHPDYHSTRYALSRGRDIVTFPIQHHHAHAVSCMAENGLDGEVIAIVCDGAGYGEDGHVWGGEVLIASESAFERAAHFEYAPMPGGEAAIREPWRMGLSYLHQVFGKTGLFMDLPFVKKIDMAKRRIVGEMIEKNIHTPLTSSLGRLFDGVAAIIGLRDRIEFEGQAAMELEMQLPHDDVQVMTLPPYPFSWDQVENRKIIHLEPFIQGVVADVRNDKEISFIASRFHGSLIHLFTAIVRDIEKESGIGRVLLTGGAFQNSILLSGLTRRLSNEGFSVFSHRTIPANDGGISLGQAVIAGTRLKRE